MQIALTPSSAAEVRLLAAFMQDYADLLETQLVPPPVTNESVAAGCAPFQPAPEPAKKSRTKKDTTSAAPAADGNAAPVASEPAASTEAPAGSTSSASEAGPSAASAEPMTHDKLRVLFGELSQRGEDVKMAIVGVFKELGYPNIKAIPAEELQNAHDLMVKAAG